MKGLTWWQRIWRNHGQSGINRAYRSYQRMMEQFEKIQRECNDDLAKMLENQGKGDFQKLHAEIKQKLILAAEKQLVKMRRNYFDSSNLNPHSYATYLIHYISRLKEKQPSEQSKVQGEQLLEQGEIANVEEPLLEQSKTVIIDDTSYQPLFAKEKIKMLYEEFKSEYEKNSSLNSCKHNSL